MYSLQFFPDTEFGDVAVLLHGLESDICRPERIAAMAVVPDPMQLSSTVSPSSV